LPEASFFLNPKRAHLIINIYNQPTKIIRNWAILRSMLPCARIVAITYGEDDRVLEATLAAGFNAIHPPKVEPDVLCRAVRSAAQGLLDYDAFIVERVREIFMANDGERRLRFGGLTIDLEQQQVTRWGKAIQLSELEFKVLAHLAIKQPAAVSSAELLEAVWRTSPDMGGTVDQVKSCIKRLRQKIELDARRPRYIRSVRCRGYVLSDPMDSVQHR
jgi:DNA-binding winged helix-turn-helix (wHTH) protein